MEVSQVYRDWKTFDKYRLWHEINVLTLSDVLYTGLYVCDCELDSFCRPQVVWIFDLMSDIHTRLALIQICLNVCKF